MTDVHASRVWPMLWHGGLGLALAVGVPGIAVFAFGEWDPQIGARLAWTISAVIFGMVSALATLSFAVGIAYAPRVALSDQRKLTALGPAILVVSLVVVLLEQRGIWLWMFLTLGQGFFAVTTIYFGVRTGWLMPAAQEPRCATCRYLLAGLRSSRCPECGEALEVVDRSEANVGG